MAQRKRVSTLLAVVMMSGVALLGIATTAQAALRHIEGTVVSKNANARTFKVATQGGRSTGAVEGGPDATPNQRTSASGSHQVDDPPVACTKRTTGHSGEFRSSG